MYRRILEVRRLLEFVNKDEHRMSMISPNIQQRCNELLLQPLQKTAHDYNLQQPSDAWANTVVLQHRTDTNITLDLIRA